ncbi:MAG: GNAT family N-acetyltransferase [Treponema sp.]|nr:GNAT family N-acetyltransferase [Treponema sp.]
MQDNYRRKPGVPKQSIHHMQTYPLRYTPSGLIFMGSEDDCDTVVDIMLATSYSEEFCIGLDWDPSFIARLMQAGFLVMSETLIDEDKTGRQFKRDIILPKLHLVRSALFFQNLHVKRSIKPYLSRYELRFDTDFETIVNKCLEIHGNGWLTPSLVKTLFVLREQSRPEDHLAPMASVRPVSFGLYKNEELKAGEFGVIYGQVYTSYSGYREENNAGTVQMILMIRALEEAGFVFLDFGMPLDYKTDLGSIDISPEEFVSLFRTARHQTSRQKPEI